MQDTQSKGGPTTPEGKAISAKNSTKHGLYARHSALNTEDQAEYQAFLAEYMDDWKPVGATERDLVLHLADCVFRAQRYRAMEISSIDYQTGILTDQINKIERADAPLAQTLTYEVKRPHIDFIGRHEARLERMAREARNQLIRLQDRRLKLAAEAAKQAKPAPPPPKKFANEPLPRLLSINDTIRLGLVPGLADEKPVQDALLDLARAVKKSQTNSPPNYQDPGDDVAA